MIAPAAAWALPCSQPTGHTPSKVAVPATPRSSTLGPRGMDKLIHDENGNTTISNDGATIMKLLDIVHPAAKTLCEISLSQDSEVGDGTTTVVLLAGELLREAKPFVEEGVHPRSIVTAYRSACRLAVARVKELSVDISGNSDEERRSMLEVRGPRVAVPLAPACPPLRQPRWPKATHVMFAQHTRPGPLRHRRSAP